MTVCRSLGFNKTYCAVLASDICLPRGSLPALVATGGACRGLLCFLFSSWVMVMNGTAKQGFTWSPTWCNELATS